MLAERVCTKSCLLQLWTTTVKVGLILLPLDVEKGRGKNKKKKETGRKIKSRKEAVR